MPNKKVQDIIVPVKKGKDVSRPMPASSAADQAAAPRRPRPSVSRFVKPRKSAQPSTDSGGTQRPLYTTLQRGRESGGGSGRSRLMLWGIAGLALIILFVAISTIFEHATLKITPQQKVVELDFFFSAEEGADGSSKVPFEVMTFTESESAVVLATEVKQVERRASGTITVYNDFNTSTQRLVKNTRFESPQGFIYRIRESVTVPGQRTVNGEKVPGTVDVIVYADEEGQEYNAGLTSFTIPGFKGSPRFDNFYARSKTEIEGGFSGVMMTVSDEELEKNKRELQNAVTQKLRDRAQLQKPDNFTLFNDALFIVFDDDTTTGGEGEDDTIEIVQTATLYGLIFDQEVLSKHLAKKTISQVGDGDRISILNIDDLDFKVLSKQTVDPLTVTSFSFSLKGDPVFVWQFDENELKGTIAGLPKNDLKTILKEFPSITRAEIVIRPFWKRSFPDNIEDFTIETIIE